ncbi:MAG: FAD:protein FMN transferase [Acidimicrobiales bacterium]|nr:FAD:protein FMN transferase [Acidimicrobiales bacterium]
MRRVEKVMGTVVSIEVPAIPDPALLDEAVAWLHHVEDVFSVFRPDSQISRIGRGELEVDHADPDVRWVLGRCEELRAATDGDFDHLPDRPDRPLDPNALVKGWSIDMLATRLRIGGATRFCINAGGDVVCAGGRTEGEPWRVGIRHPRDTQAVAAVLEVTDGAVATSGRYERGDHLRSSHGSRLVSVTVVGAELGTADALATAVFAAGTASPDWWHRFSGHELLVITDDDRVLRTDGVDRFLAEL